MVVWVVFVQPCQIDTVALCPQLFSFGRPPLRDKTGNIDSAEGIFLCEQPVIQESCDGMGVLTVEQIEAAKLKTDQRVPVQCFQRGIFSGRVIVQHGKLTFCLLHGGTKLLFVVGKITVGLYHQIDVLLDLTPAEKCFLVVRIMLELQAPPVVGYEAAAAVEVVVGVSACAELLCQCFGTELAVRLGLVQLYDPFLSVHKASTMLAQLVLDLSL